MTSPEKNLEQDRFFFLLLTTYKIYNSVENIIFILCESQRYMSSRALSLFDNNLYIPVCEFILRAKVDRLYNYLNNMYRYSIHILLFMTPVSDGYYWLHSQR